MKESDVHFVKNDDDRKAYRHFRKFYPLAALMRFVYTHRTEDETMEKK